MNKSEWVDVEEKKVKAKSNGKATQVAPDVAIY